MHLSGMKEAPEIALQDAQEDPFIGLMVFNTHTKKTFRWVIISCGWALNGLYPTLSQKMDVYGSAKSCTS